MICDEFIQIKFHKINCITFYTKIRPLIFFINRSCFDTMGNMVPYIGFLSLYGYRTIVDSTTHVHGLPIKMRY